MLTSIDLNNKSYGEWLSEAITQIPRYSSEWTNYNISDPGITMLQNFTAFNVLQEESIAAMTDPIRRRLLALVGTKAENNVPAALLVQTTQSATLPAQYRLSVGSLDFETAEQTQLTDWQIEALLVTAGGETTNLTRLLGSSAHAQAAAFGPEPANGDSFCCVLRGSVHAGERLLFWAQAASDDRRNPFDGSDGPEFAETVWQYYTALGWLNCTATDETRGFLQSGAIELTLGEEPPALYEDAGVSGFAVRCLLVSSDYDAAPRLESFSGNLFPVFQKKTHACIFQLDAADRVTVASELAVGGAVFVYCREEPGGDYHAYTEYAEVLPRAGRYYSVRPAETGIELCFDFEKHGFGPVGPDSILVCCCTEELLPNRDLGPVYGYEEQKIALPYTEGVIAESLCVLAELPPEENGGAPSYRLVRPETKDEDELCYSVSEPDGKLVVHHPAYGDAYRLLLVSCATTAGAQGNVRAGAQLSRLGGYDGTEVVATFHAPSCGFGGKTCETPEQLRKRFSHEMRRTQTAVTAEDYETLVRNAPGLCIHKVHAVAVPERNLVRVVVKPWSTQPRPALPAVYQQRLAALLDEKRMLTTRTELVSPRYVRVDAQAKLTVRPHFENARSEIENLIRRKLDQVSTDVPFGSWVRFGEIYDALSNLPCVVSVESLHLTPEDRSEVTFSSMDFRMSDRALCYPGELSLELSVFAGVRR
ncbi:MAG: baseplate J/gp47 family protein [Oscillospiraceae bacterium]|jgi:hypothetical protein